MSFICRTAISTHSQNSMFSIPIYSQASILILLTFRQLRCKACHTDSTYHMILILFPYDLIYLNSMGNFLSFNFIGKYKGLWWTFGKGKRYKMKDISLSYWNILHLLTYAQIFWLFCKWITYVSLVSPLFLYLIQENTCNYK